MKGEELLLGALEFTGRPVLPGCGGLRVFSGGLDACILTQI